MKWKHGPKPSASAQGVACCDGINRRLVLEGGRLFFNTPDARTVALDAATSRELWNTKLGEISKAETITMAPLMVKGKVLVGNSGGELGVRGWLTALEAETGKIAWRAYRTGPDSNVLIGPRFRRNIRNTAARTWVSPLGRRSTGRSAAGQSGAGSPTIPSST